MIKFLLDQGVPRSTVTALGRRGIAAEHVGDLGMATATDEEILQAARDRDAIVVTLDADFHSLLAAAKAANPSVIRIRIEGLKSDEWRSSSTRLSQLLERSLRLGQP